MDNFIAFISKFASYGLVFIICITVMVVGALIGINLRKSKNAKELVNNAEGSETEN